MTDRDPRPRLRAALLDADGLVRGVASGRQRHREVDYRRVEMRYVDIAAGRRLQVTYYDDTQAHVRNLALGDEAAKAVDDLLAGGYANWHVATSRETIQLRVTRK